MRTTSLMAKTLFLYTVGGLLLNCGIAFKSPSLALLAGVFFAAGIYVNG